MHNILLEIIEKKKEDLVLQKRLNAQLKTIEQDPIVALQPLQDDIAFKKAVSYANGVALIAEIKLASPTHPSLGSKKDILARAKIYEESGATAISFITEKHFF